MLLDPYHAQCMREEYERRARAFRLQRELLEAQGIQSNPIIAFVDQGRRLMANVIMPIVRWAVQMLGRSLPWLGRPTQTKAKAEPIQLINRNAEGC